MTIVFTLIEFILPIMHNNYFHISFEKRWHLDDKTQNLLGQCHAYIVAMLGTPILPDYRSQLLKVSLARGAQATTAIEGNTLSSAEVDAVQAGEKLPSSKEYLEKEVENILHALNSILQALIMDKKEEIITPELIRRFHSWVGDSLGSAFAADPGNFRHNNVTVGHYRAPNFEKIPDLVEKLCTWLDKEFHFRSKQSFEDAVVEAVVAHLYIEWIHPFGDGNGRTGRLLEFYILMRAGVPNIASHLLSNYYNDTREEYYRKIEESTKMNDLSSFIGYAVLGLRDGLEKVFETIQESLFTIAWNNYIHNTINELREKGKSDVKIRRLRNLALAMPADKVVTLRGITELSPTVAKDYATKSTPTLSRDLGLLIELGLIKKNESGYIANSSVLRTFSVVSTGKIGQDNRS